MIIMCFFFYICELLHIATTWEMYWFVYSERLELMIEYSEFTESSRPTMCLCTHNQFHFLIESFSLFFFSIKQFKPINFIDRRKIATISSSADKLHSMANRNEKRWNKITKKHKNPIKTDCKQKCHKMRSINRIASMQHMFHCS